MKLNGLTYLVFIQYCVPTCHPRFEICHNVHFLFVKAFSCRGSFEKKYILSFCSGGYSGFEMCHSVQYSTFKVFFLFKTYIEKVTKTTGGCKKVCNTSFCSSSDLGFTIILNILNCIVIRNERVFQISGQFANMKKIEC